MRRLWRGRRGPVDRVELERRLVPHLGAERAAEFTRWFDATSRADGKQTYVGTTAPYPNAPARTLG